MKARYLAGILAVGLAQGTLAQEGGPPAGGQAPPPQAVSYVQIEEKDLPFDREFLGVVQASRVVEVRARLRGYLAERLFEEGALVKEGDLLYRIERDSFASDVEIARARVDEAEARVTLAQRELERQQQLVSSGAVAQSELELSYTEVRAPFSGYIGKTVRDVGSFVDDGDKGMLAEIRRLDPIYVTFAVSEREYLASHESFDGDASIAFTAMLADGSTVEGGRFNFEEPTFDPAMGTIQLRAEFPNPGSKLKPGQFVKIVATGLVRPSAIVVPQRAVSQTAMGSAVLVIGEGDKLEFRPVSVDAWAGDDWIVTSGLKAGERVMVDGAMKAYPGSVVTPEPLAPTTTN